MVCKVQKLKVNVSSSSRQMRLSIKFCNLQFQRWISTFTQQKWVLEQKSTLCRKQTSFGIVKSLMLNHKVFLVDNNHKPVQAQINIVVLLKQIKTLHSNLKPKVMIWLRRRKNRKCHQEQQ